MPSHGKLIFMTGIFALSGGLTNWIAIHMLFEKVPFLYGSGVIPHRFEDFKLGIKTLIVSEFFTPSHIKRFFQNDAMFESVDFDQVFIGLTEAIENSSLGNMLSMFGGKQALEPLREPITTKLKSMIVELTTNKDNENFTTTLIEKINQVIDSRLAELTPNDVNQIIQTMIRKHLGWLVVWGGVFGGLIGLLVELLF